MAKEIEHLDLSKELRTQGIIRSANDPFIDSRQKEVNGLLD
jgi:hypothetical protein